MIDAPYALTLYAFAEFRETDRAQEVLDFGARVDAAGLMTFAFHDPKQLKAMELQYQHAAGLFETPAESLARARAAGLLPPDAG